MRMLSRTDGKTPSCIYRYTHKVVHYITNIHYVHTASNICIHSPKCKEMCCCGRNKSANCGNKYHCYRKCPASKNNWGACESPSGRIRGNSGGSADLNTNSPRSNYGGNVRASSRPRKPSCYSLVEGSGDDAYANVMDDSNSYGVVVSNTAVSPSVTASGAVDAATYPVF